MIEVVRQVNAEHPALLQQNVNASCYQFVVYLIAALRAAGHSAYHVCKIANEGQYTPPGFQPREIVGFDGRKYQCTGVSHDAIYCDGLQVDTIGSGNDADRPIYRDPQGDATFEPIGPRIVGSPAWNEIPKQFWRQHNVPLLIDAQNVPPPARLTLPDRGEMMRAGQWLDRYYRAPEGLQREQGLSIDGRPDWEGVGAWLFDVYLRARIDGKTATDATDAVIVAIKQTDEWKGKHP